MIIKKLGEHSGSFPRPQQPVNINSVVTVLVWLLIHLTCISQNLQLPLFKSHSVIFRGL